MSIGERIKKARVFRGMTQKELGIAVGFNEKNADVRIAQYESNTRRPKDNLLYKMADVLDVGFFALYEPRQYNAESIMYSLFDQGNDPMRVQLEEVLTTDGLQRPQKRIAIIYNYDPADRDHHHRRQPHRERGQEHQPRHVRLHHETAGND